MANPGLTTEQKQEAVEAVAKYGSVPAAAQALSINVNTFRHRYRMGVKAGLDEAIVHPAPQGHRIKGVSTLYNKAGEIDAQWVKTTADDLTLEEKVEAIKAAFDDWDIPVRSGVEYPLDNYPELATIYPLADWHIGLLAWHKETSNDWDLSIAQTVIKDTMRRLILSSPASRQAVVLGLGDLLHSDGYENTTARSKNLLDVDGRWPKVLRAATELLIYTIDLALLKHNDVLVRILPGNHDEESAIAVALALSLAYRNESRVTIDDDPSRFWWWTWGKTLLGATHGDKAKMKDLPLLMAARNPQAWGAAKFRSIYTGHIHTDTGLEAAGVKVESFQTPAAPDAWHHSMGYGAGRSVSSITLDRELGEIGRNRANIITS
jgi:hypothetical protein